MKKKRILILVIGLASLGLSCSNTKKVTDEAMEISNFHLGDTTNIALHDIVLCNEDLGLFIQYDSLITDSRCPLGVNCIQQGSARVSLSITHVKELQDLTLSTDKKEGDSGSAFGYAIQLIDVKPYPGSPNADTTPRSVSIQVTKEK